MTGEPRFVAQPAWDRWGGEGWAVWDSVADRQVGGWFASQEAAEVMASLENEDLDDAEARVRRLMGALDDAAAEAKTERERAL